MNTAEHDRDGVNAEPGFRLWLARLAQWWEGVWPALWPALGVAGLFVATVLFDLLPLLSGPLHGLVLLIFAGAFLGALYRARAAFHLPTVAAARRRLERASGLDHRPLSVIRDDLAAGRGDPASEALWRVHQRRMGARIGRLRIGLPTPGLPRRDPWGLRAALLLVLVIGAVAAWGDGSGRLVRALTPRLAGIAGGPAAGLEIWLTPPDYTGLAPRLLRFGTAAREDGAAPRVDETIRIPAGSGLLAQLHGGRGVPVLRFAGGSTTFAALDKDSYQIKSKIVRAGPMTVVQAGSEIGAWTVAIIPDRPPKIHFAKPPQATARGTLRLEYQAEDDFRLRRVTAMIRRDDGAAATPRTESIILNLPSPGRPGKTARRTSYHDLTAHVWAGLPVTIQLTATDAIGQRGRSAVARIVLPERRFDNPLARRLVALRKMLTRDPNNRRAVARALAAIARRPAAYRNDVIVFLVLKSTYVRLSEMRNPTAIAEAQQLLWDTALRLEDGALSLSLRTLRQAETALRKALDRNAGDAELNRLTDRLKQALDTYFKALAQNMRRHPEKYRGARLADPDQPVISRQRIERMIERMREMALTGSKDAARQLLSQLQEMMENLRTGRMQARRGANPADQIMTALERLTREQQRLLDETFREAQRNRMIPQGQDRPPASMPPDMSGKSARQGALQRRLDDLMRRLGELTDAIPPNLGQAELAMRRARRALDNDRPGQAVGPQGEALEQLRKGTRQALRQLSKRFGRQFGFDPGAGSGRGRGRDPLGRARNGSGGLWGSDIKIPDKGELQRARQILDELRRRAGEGFRRTEELDYIHRLLRRF